MIQKMSFTCALAVTTGIVVLAQQQQQQQPPPAPAPGERGQAAPIGVQRAPFGDGPWVIDTAEVHKIRLSVVTKGLVNPWSLAFLPDGNMLVTERPGRLRIIRNGVLDPTPISGVPKVSAMGLRGLMDLALHPQFAQNKIVYLTYSKPGENGLVATSLSRARLDGMALADVKELFVGTFWDGAGGAASRIIFGRDGMLYMTTGTSGPRPAEAQATDNYKGKVLRFRDDGTVPPDNPFVGRAGYKPEIYSFGHRNQLGIAIHPQTGALWTNENGPNGGDEINVILPGRNYGWPLVSLGRSYEGPWQGKFVQEGMEAPLVYWMPAIAVSGMAFYTADRFPAWKGNVFVGALRMGEVPNTGHMQRIVFNERGEEIRREMLLTDLRQRIREVKQGPDGFLYLLTDEPQGALLKIEPAP